MSGWIETIEFLLHKDIIIDDAHDWGLQVRVVNTEKYSSKFLVFSRPSVSGSIHRHHEKDETFTIMQGHIALWYRRGNTGEWQERQMFPGDSFRIPPMMWHSYMARVTSAVLETATHDDDEDTWVLDKNGEEVRKSELISDADEGSASDSS